MKQTDPRLYEIRQLPRVLLSQNAVSRRDTLRRYYDKSNRCYLRAFCQDKKFLSGYFYSLVQVFQRADRETTSSAVQRNDSPVLTRYKDDVTSVEVSK